MCGIIGYAGKDLTKFNSSKLNSLGMWNEKRGEHSCGVSTDGDIFIGVNTEKVFRDFIANTGYKHPSIFPVVIGHTRHATGGAHTIENAHPFGFGEDGKGGFKMIGVHNGTLLNHLELAREYEIDITEQKGTVTRTKIDSEILLEIVYNFGTSVLEKYNGAAALVWTRPEEPNVIYVYRGKSLSSKNEVIRTEERPLFYLQESKNSMYFSSIEDSLAFISDEDNFEVKEFDVNVVYKITDGDVENAERTPINRAGKYQKSYGVTYGRHNYAKSYTPTTHHKGTSKKASEVKSLKDYYKSKAKGVNTNYQIKHYNIANEEVNEDIKMKGKIYYNKLRYWKNNAQVTGIFTVLRNGLIYYLGDTEQMAETAYGKIHKNSKYTQDKSSFIYFYKGICVKSALDYITCVTTNLKFSILQLSYISRYPIIDLKLSQPIAFLDGKVATETFLPIAGTTIYNIGEGRLKSYIKKPEKETEYDKFILPIDTQLRGLKDIKNPDEVTDEEIASISQYKDEVLSAIDVCAVDAEEDIRNINLRVAIESALKTIKEFTKEKFETCLKKAQV